MAEGEALTSKIDGDSTECKICCRPSTDPRSLPCFHTFCCACLDTLADYSIDDIGIVVCSTCHKTHVIPEEGVKGFPAHLRETDLQDSVEKKVC